MKTYNVIGNEYYIINEKRVILLKSTKEVCQKLTQDENNVTISIYGIIKTVSKEWLYWIAYFKLDLPIALRENIFNIEFKNNNNLKHMKTDPVIPIFTKPVYVGKYNDFRLIPRFPNYAINYNGIVMNVIKNEIKSHMRIKNGYKKVTIVDQAKVYKSYGMLVHRLVAMTWLDNPDYEKYYLVDHKDGDKTNCHYTNLKWTDHKGNNQATTRQNVRKDNFILYTRDINTGKIKKHYSLTESSKYIGRSRINLSHTPLKPGLIWRGKNGEFELNNVPDEWYYDKLTVKPSYKVSTIVKFSNDLENRIFKSIKEAARSLLKINSPCTRARLLKGVKQKYPKAKIEITDNLIYQAKDKSNKVYEATSITRLIEKLPIKFAKSTVTKYIDKPYGYNGFQFRLKPNYKTIPWLPYVEKNINKPMSIDVIDGVNIKTFTSLRSAAKDLSIDKKTIKNYLDTGNLLYNKYKIQSHPI